MYWLFLALSIGALAVAFTTSSTLLLVLCLLASLGLFLAWAVGLYKARIGDSRSDVQLIDPVELKRLREQAEARKAAGTPLADPVDPPSP